MWIESHQSLLTHRKTGRLSRSLSISKITAIGHLHAFWWWCMDNAKEGDLSTIEPEDIADGAYWEGDAKAFLDALIFAGFVESDADGVRIHDWHEYAGKLIDRRKSDAERKKHSRQSQHIPPMSAGHPPDGGKTAYVPNRTEPYLTQPNGIDAAARGALTGDFLVDTLAQFPHWEATLEERVASVKPLNPNGFRVTVLRGWVASPEKAPPLPYVPAELTLADDWKPGDRVEICPGVFAVASHAKDHRAPLGTLRFPGTVYSRSECRDKQETPSFLGRNVSTMDGASITPVPGWVCIVDRSWYTVGDNPGDPPRRCDGAGNLYRHNDENAAPVAVPLSPPKPFVKPGGAVLSC